MENEPKKRGGRMKKKKATEGAVALLDAIWKKKGGPAAIAHLLNIAPQIPVNWRNRGGVPLIYCMQLATKLNVIPWGLNYVKLRLFDAKNKCPPWEVVVKGYGLPTETVEQILKLPPPIAPGV